MSMKFRIKETGELKELSYIDCNTGIDCIKDVIGNSGAIGDYIGDSDYEDDDADVYGISQDNFEWWEDYIDSAESDDQELSDLRNEYNHDDIQKIIDEEWHATGDDYNDHHDINRRVFERIKAEARCI